MRSIERLKCVSIDELCDVKGAQSHQNQENHSYKNMSFFATGSRSHRFSSFEPRTNPRATAVAVGFTDCLTDTKQPALSDTCNSAYRAIADCSSPSTDCLSPSAPLQYSAIPGYHVSSVCASKRGEFVSVGVAWSRSTQPMLRITLHLLFEFGVALRHLLSEFRGYITCLLCGSIIQRNLTNKESRL